MIVACKRLLAPYADLLEPYQKRTRLDAHMAGPEEDSGSDGCATVEPYPKRSRLDALMAGAEEEPWSDGCASATRCQPPGIERRRQALEDFQEASPEQPSEKRLRTGEHFAGSPGAPLGSGGENREVAIHRWAEDIVKALLGCPSVEEAVLRCARALSQFDVESREAALRGVDVGEEGVQSLQHTKAVLMRAVNHLAQRCRQNEAAVGEADALREELEKAREAQSRLAHHNEMLKHHLRLELDR